MKSNSRHAAASSSAATEHPQARRQAAERLEREPVSDAALVTQARQRSARSSRSNQAETSGDSGTIVDEEQRREMIATAAFLRAERRGFESGSDLEDWLAAEEEVDQWLRQVDVGEEEPPLFEE
jgi:hypothetical protein